MLTLLTLWNGFKGGWTWHVMLGASSHTHHLLSYIRFLTCELFCYFTLVTLSLIQLGSGITSRIFLLWVVWNKICLPYLRVRSSAFFPGWGPITTFLLKLPKFVRLKSALHLESHCSFSVFFEVKWMSSWALEFLGAPTAQAVLNKSSRYLLRRPFVVDTCWLCCLGMSLLSCHNHHSFTVFFSGKLSFPAGKGKNSR